MIGSIVSAGMGGLMQVGTSIYGTIQSAKQNQKAQGELDARKRENDRWYNLKKNEDYTKRTDVQNVFRKQRELLDEQYKRARATNIVAGGTDEALALQQAEANRAMGETMADVAANASAYKDNVEAQYRAQKDALSKEQQQIYANQAQATASAAAQASNVGATMLTNGLEGITKAKVGPTSVVKEGGN